MQNLDKAPKLELLLESATKKVKRGIFLRKSTDAQVRDLEKKFDKAQQARADLRVQRAIVEEYPVEEK